jgi:hypothetical protein
MTRRDSKTKAKILTKPCDSRWQFSTAGRYWVEEAEKHPLRSHRIINHPTSETAWAHTSPTDNHALPFIQVPKLGATRRQGDGENIIKSKSTTWHTMVPKSRRARWWAWVSRGRSRCSKQKQTRNAKKNYSKKRRQEKSTRNRQGSKKDLIVHKP